MESKANDCCVLCGHSWHVRRLFSATNPVVEFYPKKFVMEFLLTNRTILWKEHRFNFSFFSKHPSIPFIPSMCTILHYLVSRDETSPPEQVCIFVFKGASTWWLWWPNDIRGSCGTKVSWHSSYRWGKTPKKPHSENLSRLGIEPGPAAWQACMLPLAPLLASWGSYQLTSI